MAKNKEFKTGRYAVIVGIALAVILTVLTIFAYTTRYNAFDPEKVAQNYVDTIVQTGDGYNAYKVTLVSKNQKFGNFVIDGYMAPFVNDGEDVKQAEFVGTGSKEEMKKVDELYGAMYNYYVELINQYSLDDYDSVFNNYFKKLVETRKEIYGDDYMDTEFMFSVFEANVDTYGKALTGVKAQKAENGQAEVKEVIGKYQEMFGKDYKLTCNVTKCDSLKGDEAKTYIADYKDRITPVAAIGEEKAKASGLDEEKTASMTEAFKKLDCSEDVSDVALAEVEVKTQDGKTVATQQVYMLKIGKSWYVDNTNTDTKGLYLAK
ncbi:MAG: hypothetical protein IJT65_04695 [Eubacterium sp.]|nr:hypothetical protein [Eubacterium sp.]